MLNNKPADSVNVFGGEIQYFHLDTSYWKLILEQFKEAGLKNVTTYVQWANHCVYTQPRNLFSAVLHEGPEDRILFPLNHYPEVARVKITLAKKSATCLVDLESGETIPIKDGSSLIDLDRKSAAVFRVL